MKRIFTCFVLLISIILAHAEAGINSAKQDTNEVKKLYTKGFDIRLTDATQTIRYADKALNLAKELNFTKGIAEGYRIKGLGQYYLGNSRGAIENYLLALSYFQELNDILGEVRIYNNIGSLYQDVDYDKCVEYLTSAINLYEKKELKDDYLLASIYINFGNVYQRKKNFRKALENYNSSYQIVSKLGNTAFLTTVLQDLGVVYSAIGDRAKAKELLFRANKQAKELDLNQSIVQINLSLAELYIAEDDYNNAEKILNEGRAYASLLNNEKVLSDYQFTFYQLEVKRKNFERALGYLQAIHREDSIQYRSSSSAALSIYQVRYKQNELQRENELITSKQRYNRNIAIGVVVLAVLLGVVVVLLIGNVKRKAQTNKRLTELNNEISVQKDNLDRINHHLEEIIDERTKDLQIKNKKLSEYSSYLSHQIRGPIATLKGLMNLEREGLVTQTECINMMLKCVSEIDDKIMDMSDMLHNPERAGM